MEPTVVITDTQTPIVLSTNTLNPQPTAAGGFIPVTGDSCIPDNPPQTGKVLDIVDGDTIVVVLDQDGKAYSVRYIGVDAPESTVPVEPFGHEAAAKNRELVHGKNVTLVKDVSENDGQGHLLRYVIADGIFVNYELVAQGYAKTASYYSPDVACTSVLQAAEKQASTWRLGLWGNPPPPTAMPTGASSSVVPPVCSCSGSLYNCSDFSTRASAQACYDYCNATGHGDIHRLDGDNDGSACEDLP
jgi:micrococcal nuclease